MTEAAPILNDEAQIKRMSNWVERLRRVRIFRRLKVDAEMLPNGEGWVQVTVNDGLTTISTTKLTFHVATMEWQRLYELIETDLLEAFKAHVRKMTVPELMLPGTVPVDVKDAVTDGERYVF